MPYWFFSPLHCERPGSRNSHSLAGSGTPWPHDASNVMLINTLVTPAAFPLPGWRMPPYHAHYCGWGLTAFSGRRYAFVYNKRNTVEWGAAPVNFLGPAVLAALYDALTNAGWVMLYHRAVPGLFASEPGGFANDTADMVELAAHAASRHGDAAVQPGGAQRLVLLPELLLAIRHAYSGRYPPANRSAHGGPPEVSVNAVQMALLADADMYVAVQGGPAYLSLLWGPGKRVLLLQKKGNEVGGRAERWFHLLSGAPPVFSTREEGELVAAVQRALGEAAAAAANASGWVGGGGRGLRGTLR